MTFTDADRVEIGRRIRAAMGYAGWKRPEFAAQLATSIPTLRRWEEGKFGKRDPLEIVRLVLRASGAPPALFSEYLVLGDEDYVNELLELYRRQVEHQVREMLDEYERQRASGGEAGSGSSEPDGQPGGRGMSGGGHAER